MTSLELRRVGDAVVVAIPTDVLARYDLKEGDRLSLDQGSGGFTLRPEHFLTEQARANRVMDRYHAVLKRLAE